MELTATFRLLYSGEAGFYRKLEAAEKLVYALLGSGAPDAVAEAAALPPLVAAHYLRSLVGWSSSAVIKGGTAEAAGKKGKQQQQQQQGKQAAPSEQQAARLEPRCWAVLVSLLSSQSIPSSQPLPMALLPAVTAALQQAGQGQGPGSSQQAHLLCQLAALLRLLAGKFGTSFRPVIEHAATVAEAALAGHAAAHRAAVHSNAVWEEAACAAVQLLAAVAAGHPNQRKVWDAAVPRLLPLLAGAAFPAGSAAAGSQLASSCRQVLEAVLLSQQHVVPLATAAAAEFSLALADADAGSSGAASGGAAEAGEFEEDVDEAADGGAAKHAQHAAAASYATQLFAALRRQVAAQELPLELLPWMAGCFCAALKQHRHAAETEAALTSQADRRSKAQQQQAGEDAEEGGAAAGGNHQRKAAGGSGLSVSADFHFWVALLRTLTPHMQEQQGQTELIHTVSGVALLAAALRRHQLYRPTQDPAGQQRSLLQQLAHTALALAQQQHGGKAAGAAAPANVVPAALGVIQGILAVEHRVIQQQLPLLWPLLLQAPQAAAMTDNCNSSSGGSVAVAVACSLVVAFAELRQLEVLLRSLTEALLQSVPEAGWDAASAPGAAAAAVLGSSEFQTALATAVRRLPSGQVPMLLRLVAEAAPQLSEAAPANSLLAADLWCCCLACLNSDLTIAAAAAGAAAALVAALAPVMLPLLSAAVAPDGSSGSAKKQKKQQKGQVAQAVLLPALLRLYRRALLVHAGCAGLHPQVAPLPGQHVQPANGTSGPAGYFAPLLDDAGGSTPDLAMLLASSAAASNGELWQALLQAAEQRVFVLHQQQRYLTHTCPVTLLPEPGTEQAEQQAAQQAQQAQQAQHQLTGVESELRQLADVLAGAAAAEAAAAVNGKALEAMQLAAGMLPILQEWAPPAPLQQLLQACLRQAAGSPGSYAAQLCRSLLTNDELVEQRQLTGLLPAAAAAELATALSAALGGAAEDDADGSAKKKRKKGKEEGAAAGSDNSTSGHTAALLQQLGRLAKGKALKSASWAAAIEGSSASIVAAAADLSDRSSSKKKRKQRNEAATEAALQAVQQQLHLLAQLPLAHLLPEDASGLLAVAIGSLLCCWEASLAAGKIGKLIDSALPASTACSKLLARLAGSSNDGSLEGQQLVPVALQAALTAAMQAAAAAAAGGDGNGTAPGLLAASADHSRHAMQALCIAQLAAGDGSVQQLADHLSAQMQQERGAEQWAATVLAQGCLAACCAVTHDGSRRAATDILCRSSNNASSQQQAVAAIIGSTAASLEFAVAAALPAAAQAAAADDSSGQAGLLAGGLYSCAALLLQLRCCDRPAAEVVEQAARGGSSGVVGIMAAAFQPAAALLDQLAAGQPGAAKGLLMQPLLEYVAACCSVTGRMRPAAGSRHCASLLALLLHLLGQQAVDTMPPPSRHTTPFAAAFPAAAAAAEAAGSSAARPLLLDALRNLVAGSSSQQLLLPLRFVEAALPAAAESISSISTALPLCELLLALLEAASGGRQQRLLAQHGERVSGLLTGYISSVAYGSLPTQTQQAQQPALATMQQLAAAILEAGDGGALATTAAGEVPLASATPAAGVTVAQLTEAATPPPAAEVAALCTALRALESLAARPKLFQLPPAAASSMVASVVAVWTAYAEHPGAAVEPPALPGFCFSLDVASGAGLFSGSCHLLLALLRHRQQELRRCLPLVLQALRALLRFLVAAELSARLQQCLGGPSAAAPDGPCGRPRTGQAAQERRWRIKCAELLASVLTELAGLKEAGVGRYCPHLLADYLILAAAPPSGKSKALLRFHSPARALAAAGIDGSHATVAVAGSAASGAAAGTAAAAEEEEVLAGESMSRGAAAALRQGAYALYGACSSAEIQFLYASLATGSSCGTRSGSAAVASWRAALSALKADFEKHHKYTGKV